VQVLITLKFRVSALETREFPDGVAVEDGHVVLLELPGGPAA
jgi:hypothetical protein